MKRAIAFIVVAVIGVAALYFAQKRQQPVPVNANPMVEVVADVQRDVTRVPMRLTRISDEQEIQIGNELASQYSLDQESLTPEQRALRNYVRQVGGKLAAQAHRKLPYQFDIIPDSGLLNAFSIPGGHVFIGTGLMDLMTSEDELANVLAHEIEHIDHYHCVERFQVEAHLRKVHLEIVGELAQIPLSVWEAGYNKDQELEADREGMRLAVAAGYSPYGAVEMFQRFAKLHREYVIHAQSPEQELTEVAIQGLTGYFRSHPLPSERLAQANNIIAQEHWQTRKKLKPFRIEYEVKAGQ
jgi:predicted Zn-dependent protease